MMRLQSRSFLVSYMPLAWPALGSGVYWDAQGTRPRLRCYFASLDTLPSAFGRAGYAWRCNSRCSADQLFQTRAAQRPRKGNPQLLYVKLRARSEE